MKQSIFVPDELQKFFRKHARVALAFSGGSDSAYLLYAAMACGADVRAYYVHSRFQPEFELQDARRLAAQLGADMRIIDVDVLSYESVRSNPPDRCYYCKQHIFGTIMNAARADGYDTIIDGTNASDDAGDRPGMRALQEMKVLSPLRICGIDKARMRQLSREAGLFTWNKPAYACLATRIPAGTAIDADTLAKVERAEAALAAMGFSDFRVRVRGSGAQLELCEADAAQVLERREEVIAVLEKDFSEITLNLRLRKGIEI